MLQRLMFGVMYRLGFTPWDGHALPARLRALLEGPAPPRPGRAIDLGCGTGDTSIYLARHGWDVTALDFVKAALARARAKGEAARVNVRWLQGDVTRLRSYVNDRFDLLVDSGCMHGLSDEQRAVYVRELAAVAAPGASLIIAAFGDNPKRRGPRGISADEVTRRFQGDWQFVGSGADPDVSNDANDPIHVYELRRT